jgi:Xaa-Pro aminopeptidase
MPEFDQHVIGWLHPARKSKMGSAHPRRSSWALDHVLHDMRLYKSRERARRDARVSAEIAVGAQLRAMSFCVPACTNTR